jgi:hypothetical protein
VGPRNLFDLTAEARDGQGNTATAVSTLSAEPFGENVLLRLDKAIYKGGEPLQVDAHTSADLPLVYLDVVRAGQILLTKTLPVEAGKASCDLELPPHAFGSLELHAYQVLPGGEVIRSSRVAYVNPADGLKIAVRADRSVYRPGAEGTVRFRVTDREGRPAQAALGVLVVDEAVYALQEMQPGLEKVYFTLQEELLRPKATALCPPSESLDNLVREEDLDRDRQQAAEVLLTAAAPTPPARWLVDPGRQRRQQLDLVKPGAVARFPYTLRPKYPIRAKAPATVAYEYYTPANRATAPPVELVVQEK